jgi:hypothetical protein
MGPKVIPRTLEVLNYVGQPIDKIAEAIGVKPATVRRYIVALRVEGYEIGLPRRPRIQMTDRKENFLPPSPRIPIDRATWNAYQATFGDEMDRHFRLEAPDAQEAP